MDLAAGTVVNERYRIESQIGEGGMAVVYRARHTTLGTLHAIKVLTMTGRAIRDRMIQEGRLQAQLRHPNIVAVTDVVDVSGAPALVMELVEGPSLDELVKQQKLTLEQADAIGRGVLAGVAHAHAQGLVHRDLKPANVMLQLVEGGVIPKVTDFGLAKVLAGDEHARAATRTGATMGTPQYMSPEQIKDAKNVDARSDVFACGAILYELVTGHRAFDGENLLEIFGRVARAEYVDPRQVRPDAPDRMLAAIEGALRVDPAARTPSVSALYGAWTGGQPLAATSRVAVSLPSVFERMGASLAPERSAETLAVEPASSAARSLAPTLVMGTGLLAAIGGAVVVVALLIVVGALLWTRPAQPVVVERTVFVPEVRPGEPVPAPGEPVPMPGEPVPAPSSPDPVTAVRPAPSGLDPVPVAVAPTPDPGVVPWNELPEEVRDAAVVELPEPEPAAPEPVAPDPTPPPPPDGVPMTRDDLPSSLRSTSLSNRLDAVNTYRLDKAAVAGRYLSVVAERDPDATVRREAVIALMWRWDAGYAPTDIYHGHAVSALGGDQPAARDRALKSYTAKGRSLAPLEPLLNHADAGVRRSAAVALGQVGARMDLRDEARRMLAARKATEQAGGVNKAIDEALLAVTGG